MEKGNEVPEFEMQDKGFFIEESQFGKFSKNIFTNKLLGFTIGILLNIVYLSAWKRNLNILPLICLLFTYYLIINIILVKVFKMNLE